MHRPLLPDLQDLRRALRRRRRTLAVLLLALVAVTVLPQWAPASARTVPVVVTARDLAPGHLLATEDLTTVDVAEALAPAGPSVEDAVGRRLTTTVAIGTPLDTAWLRNPSDPRSAPGTVVLAVPVDPSLVTHLTPGTRVQVITSTTVPGDTTVTSATVVEMSDSAGQGEGVLGAGAGGSRTVVLATDPGGARDIAYATREGWVALAILG